MSEVAIPPGEAILGPLASSQAVIEQVLALLNGARGAQSQKPLVASKSLTQAAQEHTEDMVKRGYFSYHAHDGGEGVEARLRKLGYTGRTAVNLGRGPTTAQDIVGTWLSDAGTRASILDPTYRDLGVASFAGHWTLLLGAPEQSISDDMRQRVLDLLNEERRKATVPALELQKQLNYVAQMHCLDMMKRNFFASVDPDGKNEQQRVNAADYTGLVRELLVEADTAEDVYKKLLGNAAWRSQIDNKQNAFIGVGMFNSKWTVLLGQPPTKTVKSNADLKREFMTMLEHQRTDSKRPPFKAHAALEQVAEGHAADMVEKGFYAYEQPGSLGIPGRIKQSGYRGRTFPAIAKGQVNADAVFKMFIGSEGHRKNILDPEFRDIGMAVKDSHWVVVLGAPAAEASADLRGELQKLLNSQRAASSAPAVSLSPLLNSVAQEFAQDMVKRDFFGFTNPDGMTPDALAKRDGFPGRALCAIARGHSVPEAALEAWLKSPQNRTNLLDPQFALLGIGVAESRWVIILGTAAA